MDQEADFSYDAFRAPHSSQPSLVRTQRHGVHLVENNLIRLQGQTLKHNVFRPKPENINRPSFFPALHKPPSQPPKNKPNFNPSNQAPKQQFFSLLSTLEGVNATNFSQPNIRPHALGTKEETISDDTTLHSSPPQRDPDAHISAFEVQRQAHDSSDIRLPHTSHPTLRTPVQSRDPPASTAKSSPRSIFGDVGEKGDWHGDVTTASSMPNIAIQALREVETITADLAEERSKNKSLLAQLKALSSSHEKLSLQQSSTSAELEKANNNLTSVQQQLRTCSHDISVANQEIAKVKDELLNVTETKNQLETEVKLIKEEAAQAKLDVETARNAEALAKRKMVNEREERRRVVDKVKADMIELENLYKTLQEAYKEMKDQHGTFHRVLGKEVKEARASAIESVHALSPLLDEDGTYQKSKEVKALMGEMQDELADSQRVVDLLRDKLHTFSTQLAESQVRVKELESQERNRLWSLLKAAEEGNNLGTQEDSGAVAPVGTLRTALAEAMADLGRLMEKLAQRERETIDALAETAGLEEKLGVAHRRIVEMQEENNVLRQAGDTKSVLEFRISDMQVKIKGLEDSSSIAEKLFNDLKRENSALEARHIANQSVMDEVRTMNELTLTNLKKDLEDAKKNGEGAEDNRRQSELRAIALQERFDAQTITLRLTKEQCGDLQERLHISDSTLQRVQMESKENINRLSTECSRKEDAIKAAEATLSKLQKDFETQATSLQRADEECKELRKQLNAYMTEDRRKIDGSRKMEAELARTEEKYNAQAIRLTKSEKRCEELQDQVKEYEKKMNDAKKTEVQFIRLQERFEEQTASLGRIEQRYRDLERSSTSVATELASAQAALKEVRQELLAERKAHAASSQRLAAQFVQAESEEKKEWMMGLVDVKEILAGKIKELEEEVKKERVVGDTDAKTERIRVLEAEVENLTKVNAELVARTTGIQGRYENGTLTEEERQFVTLLMHLSDSSHEQEDVMKNNELRRRDNMLSKKDARIRDLEVSLACALKQQQEQQKETGIGLNGSSIIDLDAWITSSPMPKTVAPQDTQVAAAIPPPLPVVDEDGDSVLQDRLTTDDATMDNGPTTTTRLFTSLAEEEEEAEEDIPLTELVVLGKRNRISLSLSPKAGKSSPPPLPPPVTTSRGRVIKKNAEKTGKAKRKRK